MRRSIVYIDGFNWYHAIFKHYPEWKWLDIQSFFEALRTRENVVRVKMFSATVVDPDAKERQERYFKALRTLPKVKIVLGIFQSREVTCRANGCRYTFFEEKKTDVNIAVEMMSDAMSGGCDSMCVVSGDSDVQPAVEWVAVNRPEIELTVYIPSLPQDQSSRRLDYYATRRLPVLCKFLPIGDIKNHQMKAVIRLLDGSVAVRPHTWQSQDAAQAAGPP